MATTIPTGPLWHAYLLELSLADSPNFRTLVGAADRAEAQEHIHYPWMLNEEGGEITSANKGLPPRAIISDDADIAPWTRSQRTVGVFTTETISLMLSFDIPVPAENYDQGPKEAGYWFATEVGKIITDLEAVSAGKAEAIPPGVVGDQGYSYANILNLNKLDGPFEVPQDEFTLEWMKDAQIPKNVFHMTFVVELH